MDVITAVLQAQVNTLLIFAGIIIVFLTLFKPSLSRKTIELRTIKGSNNQIMITAILFGGGLILIGLFVRPDEFAPTEPAPASSLTISSQTPAPSPLIPSQTPETSPIATQTPAPPTTESSATDTPAPPAIGEDWKMGCISSLWIPFPASAPVNANVGCYYGSIGVFKVTNDSLNFQYQGSAASAVTQGFFGLLPKSGTTKLEIGLSHLENGEIWIGIFSKPDITSKGLLLVIPQGDVRNRLIIEKTMPDERRIDGTALISSSDAVYMVEFNISNQLVVARSVNANLSFNMVEIESPDKWLFIGFRTLNGFNRIEGDFHNLIVPVQ